MRARHMSELEVDKGTAGTDSPNEPRKEENRKYAGTKRCRQLEHKCIIASPILERLEEEQGRSKKRDGNKEMGGGRVEAKPIAE